MITQGARNTHMRFLLPPWDRYPDFKFITLDKVFNGGSSKSHKGTEMNEMGTERAKESVHTQTSFDHLILEGKWSYKTRSLTQIRPLQFVFLLHLNQNFGRPTSASVTQQTFATRESLSNTDAWGVITTILHQQSAKWQWAHRHSGRSGRDTLINEQSIRPCQVITNRGD